MDVAAHQDKVETLRLSALRSTIGLTTASTKLIGATAAGTFPGIHIAFGHPYAEHTSQAWLSKTHIDCVGRDFDIWFDDEQVMARGKFLV